MLTVMHRLSDGTERLFEAEEVVRKPLNGEQSIPALGEVIVRGVKIQDVPCETIVLPIEEPFGAVFVMNRYGSTIAKY